MVARRNVALSDLQRPAPGGPSGRGCAAPASGRDLGSRQARVAGLRPDPISFLMEPGFDVVTGAFSYTGRFIARRLLAGGRRVRTLTNHPRRPGAEDIDVDVAPLQFADRAALVESLRGADVFYNTYWVRFRHGGLGFGDAVANTRILMSAAVEAGVRKVVHISVSNPSRDSHLDFYAGKARTEEIVRESGVSWAVVRPTLIFGPGDILINNIAWLLRTMPVFVIPEHGLYRVQPVSGEDVAEIATWAAGEAENNTVDAAGPEIISYMELVDSVAVAVRRRPPFLYLPPALTLFAANAVGMFVRDVILTRQEVEGLMEERLVSHEPPRGKQRVDDWLLRSADSLGRRYASELNRHW
ncbi:MAG: epimerase [Chloroflexi bacterium]|nr:MAG: epimerase [Chloroflexota bacterium]